MVSKGDRGVYRAKLQRAYDEFYLTRAPEISKPSRFEFHDTAIEKIGAATPILYLEFGVARGASIKRFAQQFSHPESRFYGFDSFIGLPQSWSRFEAGHFSTKGEPPKIEDARVGFRKGWFQNSLPAFLAEDAKFAEDKTVLVHFDADLYSSTMFVLSGLWWKIPEYYFIMDEFYGEELIALHDFSEYCPISVEFFSQMPGGFREKQGFSPPHKIFGRLRNVEMVVEQAAPEPA